MLKLVCCKFSYEITGFMGMIKKGVVKTDGWSVKKCEEKAMFHLRENGILFPYEKLKLTLENQTEMEV